MLHNICSLLESVAAVLVVCVSLFSWNLEQVRGRETPYPEVGSSNPAQSLSFFLSLLILPFLISLFRAIFVVFSLVFAKCSCTSLGMFSTAEVSTEFLLRSRVVKDFNVQVLGCLIFRAWIFSKMFCMEI